MPPFPSQRVTELGKAVLECRIDSRKEQEKRKKEYNMLRSEARLLTDVPGYFSMYVSF